MHKKTMKVRFWSKKYTQKTLRELRKWGYTVNKVHDGFYKAYLDDVLVFSALVGRNDYMCRLNPEFFSENVKV